MARVLDGWEQIRRGHAIQFERLDDGRQLTIEVDVPTQAVNQYWIAERFLPCACGSYVVFHGGTVEITGDSVTLTCDNGHRWTAVAEEHGKGDPPARGSADL